MRERNKSEGERREGERGAGSTGGTKGSGYGQMGTRETDGGQRGDRLGEWAGTKGVCTYWKCVIAKRCYNEWGAGWGRGNDSSLLVKVHENWVGQNEWLAEVRIFMFLMSLRIPT